MCASTIVPLVPSSPKESTLQLRHNDRVASQITSLTIVYSTVYSGADHRKHPCSASLAFSEGSLPVNGEFLPQKASNAENVSIWWRHYGVIALYTFLKRKYLHEWFVWLSGGRGRGSYKTKRRLRSRAMQARVTCLTLTFRFPLPFGICDILSSLHFLWLKQFYK